MSSTFTFVTNQERVASIAQLEKLANEATRLAHFSTGCGALVLVGIVSFPAVGFNILDIAALAIALGSTALANMNATYYLKNALQLEKSKG